MSHVVKRGDNIPLVRSRWLRSLLALAIAIAVYPFASPRSSAQPASVEQSNGKLPDGMVWQINVPAKWNGSLLLDLDFIRGGFGTSYPALYERGFAAAGIERIPFEKGGRDSRVSARQLMELRDLFIQKYGKPQFTIMNGASTGGVVSGYTLEHYPDRVDGAVANCTVPGYLPFLTTRLNALFVAKVFFNINLPIVKHSGTNFEADANAWRAQIDAAQATPEGKARIALALALGGVNTWTSANLPAPNTDDLEQMQAYMYDTLRNQYGNEVATRRNQEQQVGGQAFNWTTGFDYPKMFSQNVRADQKATVLKFYKAAGLDLDADLKRVNDAPRIVADPAAVNEIHLHGDYSGNPQKPFLMNNLIGDTLVQTTANQGYVDRVKKNGKGDLVRLIHVAGAGHCGFRVNEAVAAIELMNERLRTGVWPSTAAADINARAKAIDPALVPRFIDYQDPDFAGGFWTGDIYKP